MFNFRALNCNAKTTSRGICPHERGTVPSLQSAARKRSGTCSIGLGPAYLIIVISMSLARNASADPEQTPVQGTVATDDLDGLYLALGPVASVMHSGSAYDGSFGGEISLVRVRERAIVRATGLNIGAVRYAQVGARGLGRGYGRMWADLEGAVGRPRGLVAGLALGITAEVDPIEEPRWGAQATIWTFVGVIPFVRVGSVQKNGTYIDFGIKVALPVLRI